MTTNCEHCARRPATRRLTIWQMDVCDRCHERCMAAATGYPDATDDRMDDLLVAALTATH